MPTHTGLPPCYVCHRPTGRIVSITLPYPMQPLGPHDLVPVCHGCREDWQIAVLAPTFSLGEATDFKPLPKPKPRRGNPPTS